MKCAPFLLLCALAAFGCRPATTGPGRVFYLQLVRGNNDQTPPTPAAKPIGPKLDQRLRSFCKWNRYWEIRRDSIVARPSQCVRKHLSPGQDVEIELLDSRRMAVRVYQSGTLTRSRNQPSDGAFFITGGKEGADQSWFIVVRQDPPLDPGPHWPLQKVE